MELIITQWALDSYLDLVAGNVFTNDEYWKVLRPDVLLLKKYPSDPKFKLRKFWSPAQTPDGGVILDGYKMKWHQIGNGRVQLRLTVAIIGAECFLCEAYVKKDDKTDKRKLLKFMDRVKLIKNGNLIIRGKLK